MVTGDLSRKRTFSTRTIYTHNDSRTRRTDQVHGPLNLDRIPDRISDQTELRSFWIGPQSLKIIEIQKELGPDLKKREILTDPNLGRSESDQNPDHGPDRSGQTLLPFMFMIVSAKDLSNFGRRMDRSISFPAMVT